MDVPLVAYSLEVVRDALQRIDRDPRRLGKVLTFAHPDIIASVAQIREIFPTLPRRLKLRDDSAGSLNWHKATALTRVLVDTPWFFEQLGYKMTAVDIVEGRGGEEFADLSLPLPQHYWESYDFVYDCVSNQVFDVAECMANALRACRPGGTILHTIPVQAVNQGFWNVSPAAYHDFYAANGCTVKYRAIVGIYENKAEVILDPVVRCRGVADDTMNVVLATKGDAPTAQVIMPAMTKFKRYPKCQIHAEAASPT